jgi:hypothetical protein
MQLRHPWAAEKSIQRVRQCRRLDREQTERKLKHQRRRQHRNLIAAARLNARRTQPSSEMFYPAPPSTGNSARFQLNTEVMRAKPLPQKFPSGRQRKIPARAECERKNMRGERQLEDSCALFLLYVNFNH